MSHEIGVAFVCLVQSIAELICQVFLCYVRITDAAFQKQEEFLFSTVAVIRRWFSSLCKTFSVYFGSLRAKFS